MGSLIPKLCVEKGWWWQWEKLAGCAAISTALSCALYIIVLLISVSRVVNSRALFWNLLCVHSMKINFQRSSLGMGLLCPRNCSRRIWLPTSSQCLQMTLMMRSVQQFSSDTCTVFCKWFAYCPNVHICSWPWYWETIIWVWMIRSSQSTQFC